MPLDIANHTPYYATPNSYIQPSGFDAFEILFSLWAGIFIANLVGFDDQNQDNICDHYEGESSVETPAKLVEASDNESISQGDDSAMTIKQFHARRDEESLTEVLVESEEESCNWKLRDMKVDEISASDADDFTRLSELVSTPLIDENAHGTLTKTHNPPAPENIHAKEKDHVLPVPPQIQSDATLVEGENATKKATVNITAYGEFQSTSGGTVMEIKIEVCETNEDANGVQHVQTAPPNDTEFAEANPLQVYEGPLLIEREDTCEGETSSVYSSENYDSAVSELEYSADESTDPAGDLQLATPADSLGAVEQTSDEIPLIGEENISEREDPSLYSTLEDDGAVSDVDSETSEEVTLTDTVRIPWAEMDESERAEEWNNALWTLRNNPPLVARNLKASESLSEAAKLLNIPKIFAAGSSTSALPTPLRILPEVKEMDENEQSESCASTYSKKEDSPHASVIMDDIPAPQDTLEDASERDIQRDKWKRDVWALLNFPPLTDSSMTDAQDSGNNSTVETSTAVIGPVNLPSSSSLRQSSDSVKDKAETILVSTREESELDQTIQSDRDTWRLSALALANFALPSPIKEREVALERNGPVEKVLQEVPVARATQSIEHELAGSSASMALRPADSPSVEEGSEKETLDKAPTEFITVTITPINGCDAVCTDKTPVFVALGGYRRQRKRAKKPKKQHGGTVMPAATSSESEDSRNAQASNKTDPTAVRGLRRHHSRQNRAQRQKHQDLEARN